MLDISAALASTTVDDLVAASGCSKSICSRTIKAGKLPERGPNGPKLRAALEKLTAAGSGLVSYKKALDAAMVAAKLEAVRRENDVAAGKLVKRAALDAAVTLAATEMRRGLESMRREVAAVCPESHRPVLLAAFDTEAGRLRERVARALVVS